MLVPVSADSDSGWQHFVYFYLLLPLASGGHVLMYDGVVLYESKRQSVLVLGGGWTGGRLDTVGVAVGGEEGPGPGYVVVAGDESQSLS